MNRGIEFMKRKNGGLVGLVGWLYADLLLILFIGALAFQIPKPAPKAPPSLSSKYLVVQLNVPAGLSARSSPGDRAAFRRRALASLEAALAQRGLSRQTPVGMVLSFGGAPAGRPRVGSDASNRVTGVLKAADDDALSDRFTRAGFESFHSFSVPVGQVQLWVYVYVN